MADPYDLERFVQAQAAVMPQVLQELRAGRKRTHWMWFVFPQLRALGQSPTAKRYGIASLDEARAYMSHPVLGPRLIQCTELVRTIEGQTLHDIFGSPDDMKFRSSMTLFARASPATAVFAEALQQLCAGNPDPRTEALLEAG
jgi:uncharacterized protein (DUF1810 family)